MMPTPEQVALAAEAFDWRTFAEALCAVLLGLIGFMARRVLEAVDAMEIKLDRFYTQITQWNGANVKSFADIEVRVGRVEDRTEHLP